MNLVRFERATFRSGVERATVAPQVPHINQSLIPIYNINSGMLLFRGGIENPIPSTIEAASSLP